MSAGTTRRTVRVEAALWGAAQERAALRGEDMSSVIRAALRSYLEEPVGRLEGSVPILRDCQRCGQQHLAAVHCKR